MKSTPAFVQITPHIFKLDLPLHLPTGTVPVGVWLVREASSWTMIDAAMPGSEALVEKRVLEQTGGEAPAVLAFTHGHYDHAGGALALIDRWRIPVAAGRAEIPYLIGPARYGDLPGASPLLKLTATFFAPITLIGRNVQFPLDDGARLGTLEVYHAPGHAPGLVAFLHREDRALICGDVFMHLNGSLGDPFGIATYDMALNHRSQERLAELPFDFLLVSHGPPVTLHAREQIKTMLTKRKLSRH
jgi:glyoxylase-like metal-dependent hydrolase (beta-lactamase superfamily II)